MRQGVSALLLISLPTVNVLQVSTLTPGLAGSLKSGVQHGEVNNTVIPGMALTSHNKKNSNFPISFFFPLNQLFILRVTTPLLPPAPQYTGLVGYGTFQSVSLLNTKQHFLTKTTLQMKSGQVLDTHITYKLTITDLGNEQTVRKPIILMLDHRDTQLHRMGKQ